MIDYRERIEDVCLLLNSEFGVADRQAVELMLAARLLAPVRYSWLILETDFHALDTSGAWFNFGIEEIQKPALLLSEFRVRNPRRNNLSLETVLNERNRPGLFIEPQYDRPMTPYYKTWLWPYLLQDCVRIRLKYPRRKLVEPTTMLRLREASKEVLENQWRQTMCRMPTKTPPAFLYYAELLQRLSGTHRDWNSLIANLCALVSRHAYLLDRDINEEDWQAIARVMSDSVPPWTCRVIEQIVSTGQWSGLKGGYYSEKILAAEVKRLLSEAIIVSWRGEWKLVDKDSQGHDIVALIRNEVDI